MSIVMNMAPFVDITLLKRILAASISAVGMATSPGWCIWYPLTVNLFLFFYFFSVRTLQMNCPYVTSFLRYFGVSFLPMNVIVLVGFLMHPPTPFSRRLNSFADYVLQFFLYFGFLISCL